MEGKLLEIKSFFNEEFIKDLLIAYDTNNKEVLDDIMSDLRLFLKYLE